MTNEIQPCVSKKFQLTVIYSQAVLVAVMSECSVKKVICKTWIGTLENSADPDQMPQNVASDQGQYCLLKLQEVKDKMKCSKVPVQGHFPSLHSETVDPVVLSVL